jgi:hypothetical protein
LDKLQHAFFTLGHKLAALPPHKKALLALFCAVFLTELLLREFAKDSRVYSRWQAGIEAFSGFMNAIILSVVYFLTVSLVSAGMKLAGKDLLDRTLAPEPSFWRAHEPNPLGPQASVRHQF